MAELAWTLRAADDLEAAFRYLARESEGYAAAFVAGVVEAVEQLRMFPRKGRIVPEYGREDIREIFFQKYRIIYRLHHDRVIIGAIVHGARDLLRTYPLEGWDVV